MLELSFQCSLILVPNVHYRSHLVGFPERIPSFTERIRHHGLDISGQKMRQLVFFVLCHAGRATSFVRCVDSQ